MTDLDRLAGDLLAAARDINDVVSPMLLATAGRIGEDQAARAPRRTGTLARSVTVTGDDGQPFRPGDLTVEVGPTVFYAHLVEFGTARHGPQPFAFQTVDDRVDALLRRIGGAAGDI